LETKLTHSTPISVYVAGVHVALLRNLINGMSWNESLNVVKKAPLPVSELSIKNMFNERDGVHQLNDGGFAPDVFAAALYFVNHGKEFSSTVSDSISFAGSSNYCPVLVGALAGAIYGIKAIKPEDLAHCSDTLKDEITLITEALVSSWTN